METQENEHISLIKDEIALRVLKITGRDLSEIQTDEAILKAILEALEFKKI